MDKRNRRAELLWAGVLFSMLVITLLIWGRPWLTPRPAMEWVNVPAGTFMMGSNPKGLIKDDTHKYETPQHEVVINAFRIGKYEVTNAQYAQCVQARACAMPNELQQYEDLSYASYPVVAVSWYQARDFCHWVGGRLPTEAEWEYAARGTDGRIYPWGNALPTCKLANYSDCGGNLKPVGSFPEGASSFGVLDMAGNVWEWSADWSGPYVAERQINPTGPETGDARIIRGGAFKYESMELRAVTRRGSNPRYYYGSLGFRCVVTSPGE